MNLDRRALWRLGSWGVAAVGRGRRGRAGQPVLDRMAARPVRGSRSGAAGAANPVASPRKARTRRGGSASAIDTLNGDRDRLYSRVTVLEQGLDSVTGSIARQAPRSPHRFACQRVRPRPRRGSAEPPRASQTRRHSRARRQPHGDRGDAPRRQARPDSAARAEQRPTRGRTAQAVASSRQRPGNAADGAEIDHGPAGCRGGKTDRTRDAAETPSRRRRCPPERQLRRSDCAGRAMTDDRGGHAGDVARGSRSSAPNLRSMSAAPIRSAACARCGAACSNRNRMRRWRRCIRSSW